MRIFPPSIQRPGIYSFGKYPWERLYSKLRERYQAKIQGHQIDYFEVNHIIHKQTLA